MSSPHSTGGKRRWRNSRPNWRYIVGLGVAAACVAGSSIAIASGSLESLSGSGSVNYVAMGDSYSSGEGNNPFDDGTARKGDTCHRSWAAWPRHLNASDHIACSGALILNLYQGQMNLSPDNVGQISQLASIEKNLSAAGQHVNVVTLTIGGNDIGFAAILGDCFFRECLAHYDQNVQRVNSLRPAVTRALKDIKKAAPKAKVYLVGYPRLFPSAQSGNTKCGWLTPTERTRANSLASLVDSDWSYAAGLAGASYVSVLNALSGHELCTTNSWMFEVNPVRYLQDQRQGHPLYPGQLAIAKIVGPKIGEPVN